MTNEEVDLRVKALVKPECLIEQPPPITELVYPKSLNVPFINIPNTYSYNAPIRNDSGDWFMYDQDRKRHLLNANFSSISTTQTNAPAGSIILMKDSDGITKYFGRQHFKSAFNLDYECKYYKSIDGVSWTPVFLDRQIQGEDSNMAVYGSCIINFIRPSRIRNLGIQTINLTSGKVTPNGIIEIMNRTAEIPAKDIYCACPIIDTSRDNRLVFVTKYRKGNQGQDVEQQPPYEPDEHTLDTYLYDLNIFTLKMTLLNNGEPIMKRVGNEKQLYIWATLDNGMIYMNVSTCNNRHVMWEEQKLTTMLYTWRLSDALKFTEGGNNNV